MAIKAVPNLNQRHRTPGNRNGRWERLFLAESNLAKAENVRQLAERTTVFYEIHGWNFRDFVLGIWKGLKKIVSSMVTRINE